MGNERGQDDLGHLLLAGAVAATAPVIAAFLVLQHYFLQEHRAGGWLGR